MWYRMNTYGGMHKTGLEKEFEVKTNLQQINSRRI